MIIGWGCWLIAQLFESTPKCLMANPPNFRRFSQGFGGGFSPCRSGRKSSQAAGRTRAGTLNGGRRGRFWARSRPEDSVKTSGCTYIFFFGDGPNKWKVSVGMCIFGIVWLSSLHLAYCQVCLSKLLKTNTLNCMMYIWWILIPNPCQ